MTEWFTVQYNGKPFVVTYDIEDIEMPIWDELENRFKGEKEMKTVPIFETSTKELLGFMQCEFERLQCSVIDMLCPGHCYTCAQDQVDALYNPPSLSFRLRVCHNDLEYSKRYNTLMPIFLTCDLLDINSEDIQMYRSMFAKGV